MIFNFSVVFRLHAVLAAFKIFSSGQNLLTNVGLW